jgi:structure-specific recognition protein 1
LTYRFDGFQESDFDKLSNFVQKTLNKTIEKTDLALKGWNWGKANFMGDVLNFEVDGKMSFEIPLKNVSNTNAAKNEAVLQFHQNEDAAVSLMEIRFHIPQSADSENDPAQEFIQNVLSKADIQSATEADAICTLTELNCITPRGRYDFKFFTDFIDLHGKTFDYKISYDHILRVFLLPHKDGRQMYFVVAMDPPIKQGNTRYPFLIVMFNTDDEISVDLSISDKTKEKFGDRIEKLDKSISGPYHEVVSRICRTVLDKKITVPGAFTTSSGAKCYPCSYKTSSGFLYPLERGFIYVNKPTIHILFSDVAIVKFGRSQQGTRSFDLEIQHTNGTNYLFNGIDKTEQEKLQEFVKSKGMKVAKADKSASSNFKDMDSDGHDAYAERMKAEGRQKDEDEDDDEEDDEDFEAGSESDDDIEYDSNASIDSEEESGSEEGSDEGSEEEDEDDESDDDKKKKQKKEKKPEKPKEKKESKQAPAKRSEKSNSSKEKAKKAKASPKKPENKLPKSAEFIEDEDSDSD